MKFTKSFFLLLLLISSVTPVFCETNKDATAASTNLEQKTQDSLRDNWHAVVFKTIEDKIKQSGEHRLVGKQYRFVTVEYSVRRDGTIKDLRLVQPSSDKHFNAIVLDSIESLSGNPCLKFPDKLLSEEPIRKLSKFAYGKPPAQKPPIGDFEQRKHTAPQDSQ